MSSCRNGADHPIVRDDGTLRHCCDVLQGGVKKPGAPVFNPVIVDELDLFWRDDDATLVQEENDDLIIVDNA